jgi:hypothetical protein
MTPKERMDSSRCVNDIQKNHLKYIEEIGVSILHVGRGSDPDTPGWSYTVGLWHKYQLPEVILIGLDYKLAQTILNNLHISIRDENRTYADGTAAADILDGYVCFFKSVDRSSYGDWFAADRWFYDSTDFPAVQLLWPNTSNVYPWESDADNYFRWSQPVLSELPIHRAR